MRARASGSGACSKKRAEGRLSLFRLLGVLVRLALRMELMSSIERQRSNTTSRFAPKRSVKSIRAEE